MSTSTRDWLAKKAKVVSEFASGYEQWTFPQELILEQKALLNEIEATILLWRDIPEGVTDSKAERVADVLVYIKVENFLIKVYKYLYIIDVYEEAKQEATDEFPAWTKVQVHDRAVTTCEQDLLFLQQAEFPKENWRGVMAQMRGMMAQMRGTL